MTVFWPVCTQISVIWIAQFKWWSGGVFQWPFSQIMQRIAVWMPWPLNCDLGGGATWPSNHFRWETAHFLIEMKQQSAYCQKNTETSHISSPRSGILNRKLGEVFSLSCVQYEERVLIAMNNHTTSKSWGGGGGFDIMSPLENLWGDMSPLSPLLTPMANPHPILLLLFFGTVGCKCCTFPQSWLRAMIHFLASCWLSSHTCVWSIVNTMTQQVLSNHSLQQLKQGGMSLCLTHTFRFNVSKAQRRDSVSPILMLLIDLQVWIHSLTLAAKPFWLINVSTTPTFLTLEVRLHTYSARTNIQYGTVVPKQFYTHLIG